jgi:hypothetical protein
VSTTTSRLALTQAARQRGVVKGKPAQSSGYHYLDFVVDGTSLRTMAHEADMVTQLNPGWLGFADIVSQLRGQVATEGLSEGRVMLLVCPQCGDLGCGAITARIDLDEDYVSWADFLYENTYSEPLPVPPLPGSIRFDRAAYEAVLDSASELADLLPTDEPDASEGGWLWPWEWGWKLPRPPKA